MFQTALRSFAWLALVAGIAWGGHRIWERTHAPAEPPAIIQTTEAPTAPEPPAVVAPKPEKPAVVPPRVRKAPVAPGKPKGKPPTKPRATPKPAPAPTPAPDQHFPRGAANGASAALPVSCATVRWYANYAPGLGRRLAAAYHPTAAQEAAARACLTK